MPELPVIEFNRKLIHENLLGFTIDEVKVQQDQLVFKGKSGDELEKELVGRTIVGTGKYGKYLWIEFDESCFLLMHFGMTGFLQAHFICFLLKTLIGL